jgi:hypothetical protein
VGTPERGWQDRAAWARGPLQLLGGRAPALALRDQAAGGNFLNERAIEKPCEITAKDLLQIARPVSRSWRQFLGDAGADRNRSVDVRERSRPPKTGGKLARCHRSGAAECLMGARLVLRASCASDAVSDRAWNASIDRTWTDPRRQTPFEKLRRGRGE